MMMSRNAIAAYEAGEMPMSKWTKTAILKRVSEIAPEKVKMLKGVNAETLRLRLLTYTGWHHTSLFYNCTDFYDVDEYTVDALTESTITEWGRVIKSADKKEAYRGDFEYLEWVGTKKHPKAIRHKLTNVNILEKGQFYIVTDNDGNLLVRKMIGSNGTCALSYEAEERRQQMKREKEQLRIQNSSESANLLYAQFQCHGYEMSLSGHIYAKGRKPSPYDYNMGIESYFHDGEQRLAPTMNGGFRVETWNEGAWHAEEDQD